MKLKHALLLIAVLVLALLLGVPAMAQDDEPGATPTGEQPVIVVEETEAAPVEATPEATVIVVEPPAVVVVDTPDADHLTWRELGLYALVAVVVIALAVVAYRLTTMVGVSYPPGTSTALERARVKADEYTKASPNVLDDLAFFLADPLVQNAIKAVKEREQVTNSQPPDGTAVG